jgi:glycosyltransferase involved in cell wall biosynthesis
VADPLYSVIVPAYRRADFLERALRSVLAQTFSDYEIIVIDDGSDPPLRDRIQPEFLTEIRYEHRPNGGGASARNAGVRLARGELLSFLDHDDEFHAEKLALHAEAMKDKDVVLSYSRCERFRDGRLLDIRPEKGGSGWIFDALVEKSIVRGFSGLVVTRRAMIEVGSLNESYRIADDYELLFRLADHGKFHFLPEILVRAYLHSENTTRDRIQLHLEMGRVFEDLLTRASPNRVRKLRRKAGYHHRKAGDEYLRVGDRQAAIAEYRRCLAVDHLSSTGIGRLLSALLRR